MIETIESYGDLFYLVTFVWTFLEGETFVLFAGLAAHMGILRLDLLIACAWLGGYLGDQCYFFLGRRYGTRLLARFPRLRPGCERANDWLRRYDVWFILSYRFLYGIRNFSSLAMGMSTISWTRFALLNFVAAGIWAVSFAGAGYLFGHAFQSVMGQSAQAFGIALLVLFAVIFTTKWLLFRRRQRRGLAVVGDAAT